MLLDKLKELECSLHGVRRHDRDWLELLLHQEFRENTRSGLMVNRAETIESLVNERSALHILSSDFQIISLDENFAILQYRSCNPDGSRASLRSSCWVRSDTGQWKLAFHQGTPEAGSE